jgi:threonine dehydrogenase-like Zn-dependent dehydrogenase
MDCFYCQLGYSSRCVKSLLFGSSKLDGGQAEYVRVPFADGTVMKAPTTVAENMLVLMADIWPTGYYGAISAFRTIPTSKASQCTAVVIGCGPVGLCAVIAALEMKPKYLFAIDSVPSRLDVARSLGAVAFNFKTEKQKLEDAIKEATQGRGVDMVIEAVGQSSALRMAFDILRPCGIISSIGVHNGEVNCQWTQSTF